MSESPPPATATPPATPVVEDTSSRLVQPEATLTEVSEELRRSPALTTETQDTAVEAVAAEDTAAEETASSAQEHVEVTSTTLHTDEVAAEEPGPSVADDEEDEGMPASPPLDENPPDEQLNEPVAVGAESSSDPAAGDVSEGNLDDEVDLSAETTAVTEAEQVGAYFESCMLPIH